MKLKPNRIPPGPRCCAGLSLIVVFAASCSQPLLPLRSTTTGQGIEITEGYSGVFFYQVKPKSLEGKYERSNYIHPLYSLDGTVITEDFPEDHPHHHGVYSGWHQILINDKPIADGWIGENLSWEVVVAKVTYDKGSISLKSEVLWNYLADIGKPEPIVKENLTVIVHNSNAKLRIIDYEITLSALKDGLSIGGSDDEKGYGGFSVRLKLPADIRFMARGGEVKPQVVSVEAGPWMNFAGSFDGQGVGERGVVVFNHPSNPGSPHPWILRREKSMQNAAYPGRMPVVLEKTGLTLRYRVVIHNGLDEMEIEKLYGAYSKR